MNDVDIARALHAVAGAIWIGGVATAKTVVLSAIWRRDVVDLLSMLTVALFAYSLHRFARRTSHDLGCEASSSRRPG